MRNSRNAGSDEGLLLRLSLAALLVLGGACGQGEPDSLGIRSRWIEEDPEVVFEAERYTNDDTRFEWRLDDPEELSRFTFVNLDGEPRRAEDGVEVRFQSPFAKLVRAVDLQASDVQRIELEVVGAERGHVQLLWAGPGESASPDRKMQTLVRDLEGEVVAFDVSAIPRWSGPIGRITVVPTTAPGQTVVVKAIRGIRTRYEQDALTGALARPWKVKLGDDLRNAMVALPGVPLEKQVQVPDDARLRLAFGVLPRPLEPVGFRVSLRAGDGQAVPLLDELLGPESGIGWTEADLDLAAYAGRDVTLVLETVLEGEADAEEGNTFSVWANPEIVAPGPSEASPNIILISIDTLRADRMSAYGHRRPTTPALDAWARDSAVRFETVVAPSPWTLPSHVSLFTGLDAVTHGVNYSAPADPAFATLAERLRAAGYATAAFTAGAYLSPEFGLSQGFDVFRARKEGPGGRDTANELEDGLARVRSWLDADPPRPFFLFFHTYEVHTPYRARPPYFERFGGDPSRLPGGLIATTPEDMSPEEGFQHRKAFLFPEEGKRSGPRLSPEDEDLVGIAYDAGVAFMDHHIGTLLADLEESDLVSETVVVLTSDHGEMLGEHGLAAHAYLYDENILVPLIVSLPGGRGAGTVVPDQVRLTDVFPTLLELAGLESDPSINGESLLPLLGRSPEGTRRRAHRDAWSYAASSNYGLSLRHGDRLKYILQNAVWPAIAGQEELYDVRQDPRELDNLASGPGATADFRVRAREYLETRSVGLRVRFTNPRTVELRGTLQGPAVRPIGVTSPDLSCRCIRWTGGRSLRYSVPPGEEFTLHLEQAGPESLSIEGALAGSGPEAAFRRAVDLGDLDRPLELAYDGRRWSNFGTDDPVTVAASDGPPVTVRLWWVGDRRSRGEVPVEDEELLRQLRALGYVQ